VEKRIQTLKSSVGDKWSGVNLDLPQIKRLRRIEIMVFDGYTGFFEIIKNLAIIEC